MDYKSQKIVYNIGEPNHRIDDSKKGVYIFMSTMADKFEELGVIPVVVLNDVEDALPLAEALYEGGLPCAEVTFRTEAAEESTKSIQIWYLQQVQFLQLNRLTEQ